MISKLNINIWIWISLSIFLNFIHLILIQPLYSFDFSSLLSGDFTIRSVFSDVSPLVSCCINPSLYNLWILLITGILQIIVSLIAIYQIIKKKIKQSVLIGIIMGISILLGLWQIRFSCMVFPCFIGECECAKIASVKSNMHTLQTMVETYAIESKGIYPINLTELYNHAHNKKENYWKDMSNPFTGFSGIDKYGSLMDYKEYNAIPNRNKKFFFVRIILLELVFNEVKGLVLYESIGNPPTGYHIYGLERQNKFIQDKGANFVLPFNR